jgi:protein O-mannosyl-transferase
MKKGSGNKRKTQGAVKSKPAPNPPAPQFISISESLKSMLWFSLVLIALNLLIYAPAMDGGFFSWDDPFYVSKNVEVLRGLTWQSPLWAFTTGHAGNWHPLTWLSHLLDVQLYGKAAGFHHPTNILLHIANTLLLFWAIGRMTGTWRPSAVVAALFAVHPMHVESVAWISERKDVPSALADQAIARNRSVRRAEAN